MYMYSLVKPVRFKQIRHIFPIRGHSFLPCDCDFGLTEKRKCRVKRIYIPDHYIDIVEGARRRNPIEIIKDVQTSMFDTIAILSCNDSSSVYSYRY